jgi:hypothetical protein
MGNGKGLNIYNIGDTLLSSPTASFLLHNVLQAPSITKILLSVHKFTLETNTYIKFHPWHFFVKELGSRKIFLQGQNDGGLYKLPIMTSPHPPPSGNHSFPSQNKSPSSMSPKTASTMVGVRTSTLN